MYMFNSKLMRYIPFTSAILKEICWKGKTNSQMNVHICNQINLATFYTYNKYEGTKTDKQANKNRTNKQTNYGEQTNIHKMSDAGVTKVS